MLAFCLFCAIIIGVSVHGFRLAPPPSSSSSSSSSGTSRYRQTSLSAAEEESTLDGVTKAVSKSFNIFKNSLTEGSGFKTAVTEALAGDEFDAAAIDKQIEETIKADPLVLYTWTVSLFSNKALKALKMVDPNIKIKVVELDKPWSEGNPIRAVLGRKYGRTSMPCIFIGGEYVGGYEDGPTAESPGLIPLAFSGKLVTMLKDAGAIGKTETVVGTLPPPPVEEVKEEEAVAPELDNI